MRNFLLAALVTTGLLGGVTAIAAPADLPETGQTTCSDASGATIDCANTGQDGEHRAGVAWPDPRFIVGSGDTGDCVTDNLTGLMCMRAPNTHGRSTWANALTFSNELSLCGFSDWRLPNVRELESLSNMGAADGAAFLNTQGFSGIESNIGYWASTSNASPGHRNTRDRWVVILSSGITGPTDGVTERPFWPVRGGQ